MTYETRFAKRGLTHTSNLPALTIHNFRLVQATDLKFGQQNVPTYSLMSGERFSLICHSIANLRFSKIRELDVCGRPLFANPVTIIPVYQLYNPTITSIYLCYKYLITWTGSFISHISTPCPEVWQFHHVRTYIRVVALPLCLLCSISQDGIWQMF